MTDDRLKEVIVMLRKMKFGEMIIKVEENEIVYVEKKDKIKYLNS